MNITLDKQNELNSVIKIRLTPEDYKPKVEAELRKVYRSMTLPGFRPGKAPFEIVRKRYGKTVLVDELNNLLQESLYKYLSENKVTYIGHPLPKDNGQTPDWDNPAEFEFEFEMGHVPEFEIQYPKELVTYYRITATDEMTSKYIDELTRRYGAHSYPETVGEKDILYGDFNELDETGEMKAGGHHTTTTLSMEMLKDDAVKKSLLGLKKEESINLNPLKAFEETEARLMLNLKNDSLPLSSDYRFTVKTINHLEKAPLAQELFDKHLGKDAVTTEDDFRKKIKEEYEEYLMRDSDRFLDHKLRHVILNANPVSLPDEFLKRWMMSVSEKPMTMEQAEHKYMHQAEELRWKLLRDKIVETYQLNITEEEKNMVARQLVLSQFSRYGIYEVTEDKLQEFSKQYLSDKKFSENIDETILNNKMIWQLRQNVTLKEQEINYDDFVKIVDMHQHEHHGEHEHEHAH
ncbi:MAG TPA: trigger factor [Bacteroidia bacterium]|nr:trigger factor [Bacteroidia bacterium]